jgi:nitroreductase
MEKSVTDAIKYRRSVRVFKKDVELDETKVQHCIVNATLAPNSSNLQLWEFYHITESTVMEKITKACLDQNASKTANQIVVVVVRKDLWRKRANSNIEFLKKSYGEKDADDYTKREKFALNYYKKLIPSLYFDFLGILGWLKYLIFQTIGLFRPIYKEVRNSDMRIVAHKSAALAAENFMISMSAIGYDTCPMEGFDSAIMKKILDLPFKAEINMVIGCGIRDENGVYGERFRVPFDEVYFKI